MLDPAQALVALLELGPVLLALPLAIVVSVALPRAGAAELARGLYRGILDDLEAHDYNNFTRRAQVNWRGKVMRLAQAWWKIR